MHNEPADCSWRSSRLSRKAASQAKSARKPTSTPDATSSTAVRAPADLYVMVDYSESMGMPAGSADRWTAVTGALRSFITAPESAGIGVGIQYFALYKPLVQGIGASCDPRDYATPDVEIGELPGVQAELLASIDKHAFPRTMTPIGPALQGAIDHARSWAVAHPSHSVSVVLATDGEPSECTPMSVSEIASDIAAPGAKGKPRVLTFVVGVGDLGALDAIAKAGGTEHAYLATGTESPLRKASSNRSPTPQAPPRR